ncbi:MAG: hypothetical protein CMP20_15370 [Rickettsiales bacterium]|nr:hypothetical protein [Rickettsiales bacterium]
MRQKYTGRFAGSFGECVDLAFLPFTELLDRAIAQNLPVEGMWPTHAHYVPRGWVRWLDDFVYKHKTLDSQTARSIGKLQRVAASPVLATLMFRINTSHRIFSVYEEDPKWLQQLRMFMDTHCPLVSFVARLESSTTLVSDKDLLEHITTFTDSDPLWQQLEPNHRKIVSERLIRYEASTVFELNLCYKHSAKKKGDPDINDILQKALPHSGALRLLYQMLMQRFHNERFYRTLIYIVFCSLMGTYRSAASAPYDIRVQAVIWSTFSGQPRHKMQEFFQAKHAECLVIYACRQFLDYLGYLYPAFMAVMNAMYQWSHHCVQTRKIMKSIRAYFIEVAPAIERASMIGEKEAERVKSEMWSQIAQLLKIYHGDHSMDSKVKKQAVTNVKKHLDNITPARLNLVGPGVRDVDLTIISKPVWEHACTVAANHPVEEGITVKALEELGMSPRGLVRVRNVLRILEQGTIAKYDLFVCIPPIDLEVFSAYITAIKHQFKVRVQFWDSSVAVAQKLAIHRRLQVPEDCPLPASATQFQFCQQCCQFRYTIMSARDAKPADAFSTGPKMSSLDIFTGYRFCSEKRDCASMLIDVEMIGKIIIVQQDYTLCCGCGLPFHFTSEKLFERFPWCGKCDPTPLKNFEQKLALSKADREQKIVEWKQQIIQRAKRKRR